jgi:hypothetical protein
MGILSFKEINYHLTNLTHFINIMILSKVYKNQYKNISFIYFTVFSLSVNFLLFINVFKIFIHEKGDTILTNIHNMLFHLHKKFHYDRMDQFILIKI